MAVCKLCQDIIIIYILEDASGQAGRKIGHILQRSSKFAMLKNAMILYLSSLICLTAEDRDSLWLGKLVLSIGCVLLPDVEQHFMGLPVVSLSGPTIRSEFDL